MLMPLLPFATLQLDVTISIHHLSSFCGNFQCKFILTQVLLPKGNCFTTELQKQHSPAVGKLAVLFSRHTWIQSRTLMVRALCVCASGKLEF